MAIVKSVKHRVKPVKTVAGRPLTNTTRQSTTQGSAVVKKREASAGDTGVATGVASAHPTIATHCIEFVKALRRSGPATTVASMTSW